MPLFGTLDAKAVAALPRMPDLDAGAWTLPDAEIMQLAFGGPQRILNALKRWEAVGVDRVNFLMNAIEVIPQADVLASLRLFAKEVMPAFADDKPAVTA